jgi:hypothetical protein
LRDEGLLDWLQAHARTSGMGGGLAVSLAARAFVADAARASLALARALMHGYPVTVHLNLRQDLEALGLLSSCNGITFPANWVTAEPALAQRVRDEAGQLQAELGVTGLDNAQMLGTLHDAGVRYAQGPAVGRPASATETWDAHLTTG